jgi:hypothetical protein
MPNGFHGPVEEWDRMESPFRDIDPQLTKFANERKMRVRKNDHSWPERSLLWQEAGVQKLIQIFLKDERAPTYCLCLCAWEDRDQSRYWKKQILLEEAAWHVVEQGLEGLLLQSYEIVDSWAAKDLEFAAKLTIPK